MGNCCTYFLLYLIISTSVKYTWNEKNKIIQSEINLNCLYVVANIFYIVTC